MLDKLPLDIVRKIVECLDSLSIIRLESVCKDVKNLQSPCTCITVTPKRLEKGMQVWIDANTKRIQAVVCSRTDAVRIPDGVRRVYIIRTPTALHTINAFPTSLHTVALTLGQGLADRQRDVALSRLKRLRTLKLSFHADDDVRIIPPPGVRWLSLSGSHSLTLVRFPPWLQTASLQSETLVCARKPLPLSCTAFKCTCESIGLEDRLFGLETYSYMRYLGIHTHNTPPLMDILQKMPNLRSLRCTANVILAGDELATSSFLRSVKLHARYCFAVGFVRPESVERVKKIKKIVASASDEPFEFIEFYQTLLIDSFN